MRESLARAVLWAIMEAHGERTRVPPLRRLRLEDGREGRRSRRGTLRLRQPVRGAHPPPGGERRHPAALPKASFDNFVLPRDNPMGHRELAHVLLTVKAYVREFPNEKRPGLLLSANRAAARRTWPPPPC